MMSGFGAKLSRHVLGMKFMRKTKTQVDKSGKPTLSTFGSSASVKAEPAQKVKNEASDTSSSPLIVEELWSYNQCERYIFGRQSFGGFNPTVEKNVKKGLWKPFYLEEGENPVDSSDDDETKKQSDVDVSDEEMAKTYGSLIGTLAKRFTGKRKGKGGKNSKNFKGKSNDGKPKKWSKKFREDGRTDESEDEEKGNSHNNRQNQKQKRGRESTGSNYNNNQRRNQNSPSTSSKRNNEGYDDVDVPPQKRRKFLKPKD